MEGYLHLKIDVFDQIGQRAQVRAELTIQGLIEEIQREFDISGLAEDYAIYMRNTEKALDNRRTISQFDFQPGDELIFDYRRQNLRRRLPEGEQLQLRHVETNQVYEITWQPAIIGRRSNDPDHNLLLAVNLQNVPYGKTISRRHAQVIYYGGKACIERLAENNPVYLNGVEVPTREPRPLRPGNKIEIGRGKIPLWVDRSQRDTSAAQTRPQTFSQDSDEAALPAVFTDATFQPQPEVIDGTKPDHVLQDIPHAQLIFVRVDPGHYVNKKISLLEFPIMIGRASLGLGPESGVSRNHIEINYAAEQGKFTLRDLNSSNRVTLNSVLIEPEKDIPIEHGTEVGLGKMVTMRFEVLLELE